jgi:tRNA A-37 threonylcarbamoyl transferase component Bud32
MPETEVRPPEAGALTPGHRISGRYRIESEVGEGGVAQVVCVFDERLGRRVALKAMQREARTRNRERLLAAFQHEFSVLTQVAHPNVVRVYDFGFADDVPYYTMELLEGKPLSELTPLPAAEVNELLRCLCEPLSILHARRWVHRDLSARNVIRTTDGQIKLIDFGATVSMDERHAPMGTPPFMPPEALAQEPLDARADIFGLGALAYFALTGRHAYPARTLASLAATWKERPRRTRELAPETPEALDELVMSMLALDASARPRGTAEVMQHLRGGERDSILPVALATTSAHLETPKLIGRDGQLRQLQGLLHSAAQGRGAVCVIQGERGMGRSRLLDALGLQARLAGHPLLRASGKLAGSGPLALAKAVGETALRVLVEGEGPVDVLPWLRSGQDPASMSSSAIAQAQRELVDWLSAQTERATLVLLIDDVDAADSASQKFLAQLALLVRKRRLLLAIASDAGVPASGSALHVLRNHGVTINLAPFSEAEVEEWTRAVFGDVHNIARLSRWLHPASSGKPADCMAFAQYLVERGIAVRSGGSFLLPDGFDGLSLPSSVRDALQHKLAALGDDARSLLELLALEIQPLPFSIDDYLRAFGDRGGDSISALAELTAAQVLAATENGYVLRNSGVLDWARGQLAVERAAELHRKLAAQHAEASQADPSFAVLAGHHLWKAGDFAGADALLRDIDVLRHAARGVATAFTRTNDGVALYEALLAYRKRAGAAPALLTPLRVALLSRASLNRADLVSYTAETLEALRYDLGLDRWDAQPAELPDSERMSRCFNVALARHAETPENERGLAPFDALRYLATACASASGAYTIRYEPQHCWPLRRTIGVFRSVSPLLDVIADIVENPTQSLGWGADVSDFQLRTIAGTSQPIAGFDEELRLAIHWLNTYYYAQHLAGEGSDAALGYAPALEAQPVYAALGLQIRRTHALMTGRYRDAQRYRRERELLALQSESTDQHLHMSVLREQQAAYLNGDLLELTRCGAELRERSARFPGWLPWLALNDARVCALSGHFEQAAGVLDAALAKTEPFTHGAWVHLATLKAEVLFELDKHPEAITVARDVLDRAAALGAKLDVTRYRLRALTAAAEVALGDTEGGCAALHKVLEEASITPGRQSIVYGRLAEIRCMVALAMNDEPAFTEHHGQLKQLYSQHPGLRARYERLQRLARERFEQHVVSPEQPDARAWSARLQTALATQSSEDQADYLLSIVLEELGAPLGQLYRVDRRGQPVLAACRPTPPDPLLLAQALRCISTFAGGLDETDTQSVDDEAVESTVDSKGVRYDTIWLRDPERSDALRGMLVVPADSLRRSALTPDLQRALCERLMQIG